MKKVFLIAAVAVIVMVSCNKTEVFTEELKGSLSLTPVVEQTNELLKGSVNRGTIPIYVGDITVNTSSANGMTSTNFNLVTDGSGVDEFVINKIPFGQTLIEANSASAKSESRNLRTWGTNVPNFVPYINATKADVDGWIYSTTVDGQIISNNALSQMSPHIYAEYTGTANALITESSTPVTVLMTTQYGRSLVSFGMENMDYVKEANVVIKATYYDAAGNELPYVSNGQVGNSTRILTWETPVVASVWTDSEAIAGAKAKYELTIQDHNGVDLKVLGSFEVEIEAAIDKYTKVLIGNDGFYKSEEALSFDFTPIESKDDLVYVGETTITMQDVVDDQWSIDAANPGAFIDLDGEFMFAWVREGAGMVNLAGAVYNSVFWDTNLKAKAYLEVTGKLADFQPIKSWDLLVYDQYTNNDLAQAWYATYGEGSWVRTESGWGGYDAYGSIRGAWLAEKAGALTSDQYTTFVNGVKSKFETAVLSDVDKVFVKLVAVGNGWGPNVKLHPDVDSWTSIDATNFDGQALGYAIRAFGLDGLGMPRTAAQVKLIKLANEAEYSLTSIDAIAGYKWVGRVN